MGKIKNPLLFSEHFDIESSVLKSAGLIDPFLNVDTQLFIDPMLLEKSTTQQIKTTGYECFRKHFSNYVRLLVISKNEGDAAWKAAKKLLNLSEPPQTGLGYGGSSRSGSSRPDEVRTIILRTSKEIVDLGAQDPEMISLMGFFEENVGPDTISDYTTWTIIESLASITNTFCIANKVPVIKSHLESEIELPTYQDSPIILVPIDIVRALPIAKDWSDIHDVAQQNENIRNKVNEFLGTIAKPTVKELKKALRKVTLESPALFSEFLHGVKENADNYDPNTDVFSYYKLREILLSDNSHLKNDKKYDLKKGPDELKSIVLDTIDQFKHHVEKGNLWEELWDGDNPKKERAAQLIYFAIADCFCKANDVDLSPEANMGGGPIDFKFSDGYNARVLVEMKRSKGTVRHGYEKQLEIYKDASRTNIGIYVIIDFGDLGNKLKTIQLIRNERILKGEVASEILVIDATKKVSASKRK